MALPRQNRVFQIPLNPEVIKKGKRTVRIIPWDFMPKFKVCACIYIYMFMRHVYTNTYRYNCMCTYIYIEYTHTDMDTGRMEIAARAKHPSKTDSYGTTMGWQ